MKVLYAAEEMKVAKTPISRTKVVKNGIRAKTICWWWVWFWL